MARIPISMSAHVTAPRRTETAEQSGSVLIDGRVARIVGFGDGAVKLRFADGNDANIALADYVRRARAAHPPRGSGVPGASPTVPWQPTGQRARQVREMLDGYTAGRKAALAELEDRAT